MLPDDRRSKIENITQGTIITWKSVNCTAIRNFLCSRYPTSTTVKKDFEGQSVVKKDQARDLEKYNST